MDIKEVAMNITIAIINRNTLAAHCDKGDEGFSAKWAGETYKTILLAVCDAVDESNKQRRQPK